MNRLVLVALLTACGSGGTSLSGTIECGAMTCASGEVCNTVYAGVDAGNPENDGPFQRCERVDNGCELFDCDGSECPPCVIQLCGGCDGCPILDGRQLVCRGQ